MTAICGWIGDGGTEDPGVIHAMAASLSGYHAVKTRTVAAIGASAAVAAQHLENSLCNQSGEPIVAVCGDPRFKDSDLAALAERQGMARAIASAYAQQGPKLPALLFGSYALAVLDRSRGRALLAIDRMGVHPLFYASVAGKLVFASRVSTLSRFPGAARATSAQAIYDYVYFHMVPGPESIYSGCQRVLPGECLIWDRGRVQVAPYWEMRFEEGKRQPFPASKQEFIALLRESVAHAARDGAIGAFLSGGTDSSTIAGMLGEATGQPARTYSIGFEAEGYDEMHYARIAARHFGTRHHEYYVTPDDVVNAIPRIAAAHDQPFGNSSAVPSYYCAKLAKEDGVTTMLGGDGGDELFGGNTRYAKQRLYSLYSDLPPAVRKTMIEPAIFSLPASLEIFAKLQRYVRNASQEMPARYDNYNLVEHLGVTEIFTAEFLQAVDAKRPRVQMAEAYQGAHAHTMINRMLALDLRYTLADNDLPKVTRACDLAGVKVRYPMLDDDLVAFSARLAPELKVKGTRLRYFFKQALQDFLPAQILSKTKHGFGLPFGPWLQKHKPLAQIALDSLSDLKARRIVRAQFIDELTSTHVQRHAGYFGTMVWVLMMLEQWFKQHRAAVDEQPAHRMIAVP